MIAIVSKVFGVDREIMISSALEMFQKITRIDISPARYENDVMTRHNTYFTGYSSYERLNTGSPSNHLGSQSERQEKNKLFSVHCRWDIQEKTLTEAKKAMRRTLIYIKDSPLCFAPWEAVFMMFCIFFHQHAKISAFVLAGVAWFCSSKGKHRHKATMSLPFTVTARLTRTTSLGAQPFSLPKAN